MEDLMKATEVCPEARVIDFAF
ncbi:unnamed protein product [Cuscuta europaea]|nr:unnamed protein product [Cuscuta europaea]